MISYTPLHYAKLKPGTDDKLLHFIAGNGEQTQGEHHGMTAQNAVDMVIAVAKELGREGHVHALMKMVAQGKRVLEGDFFGVGPRQRSKKRLNKYGEPHRTPSRRKRTRERETLSPEPTAFEEKLQPKKSCRRLQVDNTQSVSPRKNEKDGRIDRPSAGVAPATSSPAATAHHMRPGRWPVGFLSMWVPLPAVILPSHPFPNALLRLQQEARQGTQ